ncbi:MAG: preprotein translocase subunit YajC [Candidatus Aminicenantes bacterium]|nr:preprotein translocase subunit YajC [Candidatus Aminicenantes bacterium]
MFLYGQTAGGAGQPNMLSALLPFIIIFVIFYFLIIMPARKKQKRHQELIGGLKGGERVITSGGIYGTVTRIMDDRIEIEVDKNTRLQITKSSISGIVDKTGTEVKPK